MIIEQDFSAAAAGNAAHDQKRRRVSRVRKTTTSDAATGADNHMIGADKPAPSSDGLGRRRASRAKKPRPDNEVTPSVASDAVSVSIAAATEDSAEEAAVPVDGEGTPRRKSRRGQRGGRGRNRKKSQTAANETEDEKADASAVSAVAEEADAVPGNDAADTGRDTSAGAGRKSGGSGKTAAEGGKKATVRAVAAKAKADVAVQRRMFISVMPGEQVEVALTEEGVVLEYYLEMLHQRKIKGNIYKGIVQNIDTNLQAAFVNYGVGKNGFLQVDEIHPEYWQAHHEAARGNKFPLIQKVLKVGQDVLVQVVKEPTGNKGAFLTTWLSLAGRFLVLTPGQEQTGVSRKVDNEDERVRLRELISDMCPGSGLGVIVRTVSAGATKTTLKSDLQYLKRLWRDIRKKATEVATPALVHQEPGLSERAVRDYLTDDVDEIWLDNEDTAQAVRDTVTLLFPRRRDLVRVYSDAHQPLWERFNLRRQLDQIYSREVVLPSGGRLVFDQTEAMMAIDINSGKISGKANFEDMAYKTNIEAAETIARQLKLRDVGGQVVIDFIEMREKKHVLEVEKILRHAMKNDRARHDVGNISSFGLLELVRQRTGSSALAITMEPCHACGGTGQRRNLEWQALQALRDVRRALRMESAEKCLFATSLELALYLLNHKRDTLREMEQDYGKCLEITPCPSV
ncbi:MAG: Rne/Rng family ribonuclease [Desulfovibrio sp.]|nr:Rne/Rng family ribonuclease [Desulfovibrio sp.]